MKFKTLIFILAILFVLWTIYFIYETDKPIITENIVNPLKDYKIDKTDKIDESKIPSDAKL